MLDKTKIKKLLELIEEAIQYFGPCWCKKSIGYKCPQCYWKDKYNKLKEKVNAC